MDLSNLKPPAGATKDRKRKGRGPGSGLGKTAGRGQKGQTSRSGSGRTVGFEGGQMPLYRRLPKRGFTNIFAVDWDVVNLDTLEENFQSGDVVDIDALAHKGLVWSRQVRDREGSVTGIETHKIKILARGSLTKALTIKVHKFSQAAADAITTAGGTTEVI